MEKLIVDRIEEGYAVLEKEDLSHVNVFADALGFSVTEGDILIFDGEKYSKDPDEKDARRQKLLMMQKKLKEKRKNN